jgi:hypothetical protein
MRIRMIECVSQYPNTRGYVYPSFYGSMTISEKLGYSPSFEREFVYVFLNLED